MITRGKRGIFKPKVNIVSYVESEPPNAREAIKHSHWRKAMQVEYDALIGNQTWDIVPSSPHQKVVGCKWVFKIKRNSHGSIAQYKARLVTKGFHQSTDIDYTGTYSPIVKPVTIRVLLTLALAHNWTICQVDINNAFLHGLLNETVLWSNLLVLNKILLFHLCANFAKPYMVLSRLLELGLNVSVTISILWVLSHLGLILHC